MARQERTLLVAFSETLDELATFAASHGWSLDGIEIMDLSDLRRIFGEAGQQTLFHPSEIEFTEVIERIRARIHELRPTRVVIDSLSELRHLAGEGPRYRLHMEALKPSLLEHDSTVILADGPIAGIGGFALHTLVHGVISARIPDARVRPLPAPPAGPEAAQCQVSRRAARLRDPHRRHHRLSQAGLGGAAPDGGWRADQDRHRRARHASLPAGWIAGRARC